MTDVFSPAERSRVMARVKCRGTVPERTVRRLLTALGVRYRLHRRDLPGAPDIALARLKIAVFVHGCFWHGHDCRRGARVPQQNRAYWQAKIARNRARDAAVAEALTAIGWRPVTVWECELKDETSVSARLAAAFGVSPAPGGDPALRSPRTGPSTDTVPRSSG